MSFFLPHLFRDLVTIRLGLPADYLWKMMRVVTAISVMAFLDVLSLAAVLPIVGMLLDITIIHANPVLNDVFVLSGLQQESHFILAAVFLVLTLYVLKNWVGLAVIDYQSRFIYDVASYLSERGLQRYYDKEFRVANDADERVPIRDVLLHPVEFSVYVLLAGLTFLSEAAVLALIIVGMAVYSLQVLGIMALVLGPAIAVVATMKRKRMARVGKLSDKLKAISIKYLQENIRSYNIVKLYHKEGFFSRRFIETQRELNRHFSLIHTLGLMPQRVVEVAAGVGLAALLFYGLLSQGGKDVILLMAFFVAAAYRVMPAINRILNAIFNMKAYQEAVRVLDEPQAHSAGPDPVRGLMPEPLHLADGFALERLSFHDPKRSLFRLDDINITVKRGEIIGINGRSGSGRQTLMHLIMRFLQEQSGRIMVDGRPLLPVQTRAWQGLLGYVNQEPFLLDGTILENITFAEDLSGQEKEHALAAVEQAGMKEFVQQHPLGIDTIVGDGGVELSEGETQRIAIARALYRNAQIMIFDECESEPDAETERDILRAIADLALANKSVIVVSGRMGMLKNCHRIYKLDKGRISRVLQHADAADPSSSYVEV